MTNEERHQEAVDRYNRNPKFCLNCGKQLSYEQRKQIYCNLSCASTHRNLIIERVNYSHVSPEEQKSRKREYARDRYKQFKHGSVICTACGLTFIRTNRAQKLCSVCSSRLQSLLKVSNDVEYRRTSDHSTEHRNLVKQNGWKLLPTDVVHHIDGNRRNNDEKNLLILNIAHHNKLHRFIAKERFKGSTETLRELALRFLIESGTRFGYCKPPTDDEIQQIEE